MLLLVVAAVYLNQVAFTLYVLAVHDGDPGFVSRYLPDGWFDLWTPAFLADLAGRLPAAEFLAPSVLTVQAFWELPFVLLAYLTVLRWLDPASYRFVAAGWMLWAAAVAHTAVFCAVELLLPNPWTAADVVVRVVSCVVTPWVLGRVARRDLGGPGGPGDPGSPHAAGARGLLLFGASAGALGYLVLVVYDTALLYNLGRLPGRAAEVLVVAAVLVAVRVGASALERRGRSAAPDRLAGVRPEGPVLGTVAASLRHGLVLFFVPALAVRYAMSFFGSPVLGLGVVLVVLSVALWLGFREAARHLVVRERVLTAVAVLAAGVAAVGLGTLAGSAGSSPHVEVTLGLAAAVSLVSVVLLAAAADALVRTLFPVTGTHLE